MVVFIRFLLWDDIIVALECIRSETQQVLSFVLILAFRETKIFYATPIGK